MERKTGLEPATPTLARLCSTTELLPHLFNSDIIISQFCLLSSFIFELNHFLKLDISATNDIVSYRFVCVNKNFFIQSRSVISCHHSLCDEIDYILHLYFLQVLFIFFRNVLSSKSIYNHTSTVKKFLLYMPHTSIFPPQKGHSYRLCF